MIYAGHHMAGRAPQKRTIFPVSSLIFHPPLLVSSVSCSRTASNIPALHSANVLLESDSIFALAVLSYGLAVFHRDILTDTGQSKWGEGMSVCVCMRERERERIKQRNVRMEDAFNMQLPEWRCRRIGGNMDVGDIWLGRTAPINFPRSFFTFEDERASRCTRCSKVLKLERASWRRGRGIST